MKKLLFLLFFFLTTNAYAITHTFSWSWEPLPDELPSNSFKIWHRTTGETDVVLVDNIPITETFATTPDYEYQIGECRAFYLSVHRDVDQASAATEAIQYCHNPFTRPPLLEPTTPPSGITNITITTSGNVNINFGE